MSSHMTTVWLIKVCELAECGVDFSPRHGARCPSCGQRAKIYSTKPWEGAVRVRYHRCNNEKCVLCRMGRTIKSVEEDLVDVI